MTSHDHTILYDAAAGSLHLRVIERSGQIGLYFVNPSGELDGPMSRIDPARPLTLLAEYTQALMLALIWRPDPRRICILGFGGGRLSRVLHHHFRYVVIDNVDIDPLFVEVAERFFDVVLDQRQRVIINDGRVFLEQSTQRFDIILMDAFSDQRDNLDYLGTVEFFRICRRHLETGGVVGLNLLRSDALAGSKAAALAEVFPYASVVALKHSLVLFGGGYGRLTNAQAIRRAADIQANCSLDFPLTEHAAALQPFKRDEQGLPASRALRDRDLTPLL